MTWQVIFSVLVGVGGNFHLKRLKKEKIIYFKWSLFTHYSPKTNTMDTYPFYDTPTDCR